MTETPGEDTVEATNATLPTSLSDVKKELENLHVEVRDNPISPEALKHKTLTIKRTIEMTPYENRLIIPKIAKNAPIVDIDAGGGFDFDHMENIFMKELEKGVVRYPGTATPEQNGNMFIFGHSSNYVWSEGSYNQIFALLPKLEKGDDIIVFYNQKKYTYVVREKKIVSPGDVKAIKNDKTKKEINLMTCYPIGTTLRRMIIFADLKE
jgi:LPXTG-site transpeptidase (sortase) family protein